MYYLGLITNIILLLIGIVCIIATHKQHLPLHDVFAWREKVFILGCIKLIAITIIDRNIDYTDLVTPTFSPWLIAIYFFKYISPYATLLRTLPYDTLSHEDDLIGAGNKEEKLVGSINE